MIVVLGVVAYLAVALSGAIFCFRRAARRDPFKYATNGWLAFGVTAWVLLLPLAVLDLSLELIKEHNRRSKQSLARRIAGLDTEERS